MFAIVLVLPSLKSPVKVDNSVRLSPLDGSAIELIQEIFYYAIKKL